MMNDKQNLEIKWDSTPNSVFNHDTITPFFNAIGGLERGLTKGSLYYLDIVKTESSHDEYAGLGLKVYSTGFELVEHIISSSFPLDENLYEHSLIQKLGRQSTDLAMELGLKHFEEYTKQNSIIWSPSLEPTLHPHTEPEKIKFKDNPLKWFLNLFKRKIIIHNAYTDEYKRNCQFRKLSSKILTLSHILAISSRRGGGKRVLVNIQIAALLQDSPVFMPIANTERNKESSAATIYKIGNFTDLEVYVNPYLKWNDGRILVWRTNGLNEPGLYLPYSKEPYKENTSVSGVMAPNFDYIKEYSIIELGKSAYKNFIVGHVDLDNKMY